MPVRIYQPTKTAMQSGRAKTKSWVLEHAPETARRPEALMGWVSSGDTKNQIQLSFETKEDAIAYARAKGLQFVVQEPQQRKMNLKAYADNFAFGRRKNWTH